MLRIGCATFSFGDLTLEESAEVVKGLGFNLVDVGAGWSKYQQVHPAEAAEDPQGHADIIKKWMEKHGLAISELFVMQFEDSPNHPDPESRARTQKRFEGLATFCQKAGFESIMMLPGGVNEGQTEEEAFDTSVAELQKMVAVAQEKGIQCNVEPNGGSVAGTPDDGARLCEAVPGLGLTLDYHHQLQLGFNVDQIEPMHKYAKHFHAKQSAQDEFEVKPDADNGVIDFNRLMRKLKEDNYDGVVTIEFVAAPDVIEAGWDMKEETGKMKQVIEDALAAA